MGQIPQRFIDDLLARVDVVDVVGERVQLKKGGRDYMGLCPFHQEKTPSFTVSPGKQFYHCFGCGAHGSALNFLMEYDNLSFPEAVESLAARLGMSVPREGDDDPRAQVREKQRQEGVNLMELSASFFRERLRMPEGKAARDYLHARGLSPEIQEDFAIGYAPEAWDALKRHLGERGVSESVQIEYGLLIHREDSGRRYDRFRDRVIFPIRDIKGRTIAFGGRVMGDAKPKYLNSPETPVFHKGRELYGLYEARQANRHLERLLIVEGYMDVVALAQFGIRNAVATLGTATSETHLQRLFRLVDEVVFCFDGDRAGRQAATRALETVLPLMIDGRQARFLFLPEGDDPDTLVRREGEAAFQNRITCASPLSEFLFEQAAEGRDLGSIESRERYASQVLKAVERLPDGVLKSLMLSELASRTGVETSRFEALLNRHDTASAFPEPAVESDISASHGAAPTISSAGQRRADSRVDLANMARVLQLLLRDPRLVDQLPDSFDWCDEEDPDTPLCTSVIELVRAGRYRSSQVLLAHFHGTSEGQRLAELAKRELPIKPSDRAAVLSELVGYFQQRAMQESPREEIDALLSKERRGERLSQPEKLRLRELLSSLAR